MFNKIGLLHLKLKKKIEFGDGQLMTLFANNVYGAY